jgi:hypothetical protein
VPGQRHHQECTLHTCTAGGPSVWSAARRPLCRACTRHTPCSPFCAWCVCFCAWVCAAPREWLGRSRQRPFYAHAGDVRLGRAPNRGPSCLTGADRRALWGPQRAHRRLRCVAAELASAHMRCLRTQVPHTRGRTTPTTQCAGVGRQKVESAGRPWTRRAASAMRALLAAVRV